MVHADKNISDYVDLLSLNTRMVLDKRDKNGQIVMVAKLGMLKRHFMSEMNRWITFKNIV